MGNLDTVVENIYLPRRIRFIYRHFYCAHDRSKSLVLVALQDKPTPCANEERQDPLDWRKNKFRWETSAIIWFWPHLNQVRMNDGSEQESGPVVPHHYFGGMANSQGEDETRNPSHCIRYSFESEDDIFPLDHGNFTIHIGPRSPGLKYLIYPLMTHLTDSTLLRLLW